MIASTNSDSLWMSLPNTMSVLDFIETFFLAKVTSNTVDNLEKEFSQQDKLFFVMQDLIFDV